jgi:XTP/dITP diphosphohydrolase
MLTKENSECQFELKGRVVFFATNNINKFKEAKKIFNYLDIAVGMLRMKGAEIQSENLKEIAETSAIDTFDLCHLPIMVEDAGLFVEALNGFPGPYSAYAHKTISNKGILKLMESLTNRRAQFQSTVAYIDEKLYSPEFFEGESSGKITLGELIEEGKTGFGFDPIFQPDGSDKSFAQMTIEEKNSYSHRAKAIKKFAEWYKQKR